MGTLSFTTLNVNNLKINDFTALVRSTCDFGLPVQDQMGDMAKAVLDRLVESKDRMMTASNKSTKDPLTDAIETLDTQRDGTFGDIKRAVAFELKSRDASRSAAATTLDLFLKPFADVARKALNTETTMLLDMMVKYKASAEVKAAALTIGVDGLFSEVETFNHQCDELYKQRNGNLSSRDAAGSTVRPEVNELYVQFCQAVEQSVNFTPNDALKSLFNNMETLRKKYHALLGGGDNKSTDTPTTPAQ